MTAEIKTSELVLKQCKVIEQLFHQLIHAQSRPEYHHVYASITTLATIYCVKDMMTGIQLAMRHPDATDETIESIQEEVADVRSHCTDVLDQAYKETLKCVVHFVRKYNDERSKQFDPSGEMFSNLFSRLFEKENN